MPPNRLLGGVLLLLGLLAGIAGPAGAQTTDPSRTVDVVEAVGVLDAPMTGFITQAIQRSNEEGSAVIVIRLDTPGGLGGDIDQLVAAIDASAVPVVVYVGTPGAQALGAGVRVGAAAHVLALAPVTAFGAALPQDLGQRQTDDPTRLAAALGELSRSRGRGTEFMVQAVAGAVVIAVPDGESGTDVAGDTQLPEQADPRLVRTLDETAMVEAGIADIVDSTLQGVLSRLTDLEVTTAAGQVTLDVDPVTANVRFINQTLLVRILHTAASPTLAYLLLLAGALALFFEIFQPGFGVAGFSAIGVLALGAYAMVPLPVSALWAAVAVVGLLLLAYDLAIAGLSWPSAVGTILVGIGSVRMWTVDALSPPTWLIVVATIGTALFFVLMMTSVLRAQGNQAMLGAERVAGKVGIVRAPLNPEGHIFVGGALWRARAPEESGRLQTGTKVRVLGLNDKLTLDVALVEDEADVRS